MQKEQNDEIDLLSLLFTIWNGKWFIIVFTIITSMIGTLYTFSIPNLYRVSSNISNDNQNIFIKSKSLNEILLESNPFSSIQNNKTFQISGQIILEMLFAEFNDYDEMMNVLSKNKFISDKVKNLNDFEKRKYLIRISNNFKIEKPKKKNKDWVIYFNWHDVDEGTRMFEKALKLTLTNVKNKLLTDVRSLAASLERKNQRRKNFLINTLESNRRLYNLSVDKRILYLTEQSKIAKELGIKQNNFDFSYLLKNSDNKFAPTINNDESFPYYLRGYKAIDKEIELIKTRSKKDNDLMASEYLEIQKELLLIENDNTSNELRNAAKFIVDDNFEKWINFNLEFAKLKNLKKTHLYLAFSVIIGLIMSASYILIANAISERRKIKKLV